MNTGLIWRVPRETAAAIPLIGYYLIAMLVWFLVPVLSLLLRSSESIGVPLPKVLSETLEMFAFSWTVSWIGFLIAWPLAILARRFGYIGFLPLTLCVALLSILLPSIDVIDSLSQANEITQSFREFRSFALYAFLFIMIFATPFWLITVFIWPEAFDNSAEDQQ